MGAWGDGLYSNDDAADFVDLIRAVLRLPKPVDELVDLLVDEAKDAMEHPILSVLIMADQFERRGIRHPKTYAEAIKVLEFGSDIKILQEAEMDEKGVRSRKKSNSKILDRLRNPRPEKPRKTLTKPQPAVVSAGDYVRFPTQLRGSRNPYFPPGREDFEPDGWGIVQVHDVGWEFDYLNWIKLVRLKWDSQQPPSAQDAENAPPVDNLVFGTLSPSHFKRMEMEIIGNSPPRLDATPPGSGERTARFVTLNDISIGNLLLGYA
ncbi:hypothetical protein SLH49_07485 [Cognatiyoonia sp. IB215446]|uniref:hypothetical protein n=1 Tax=Cognatiyoonia sp. IB215446 TaxID=3097355 RepID=UPI002A0D0AFE|nr:hypothetical protein [Cognatiyoonia sp. IB215446]MDX8347823.1 hypothetical protein [Cognatiyoonia sp. IB215446]